MKMRRKVSMLLAALAAVAVMIPIGSASAALNPNLSQVITAGTQSVDIVDGAGLAVGSPSVAFGATTFSFACETSTATLGTASQKIRVKNPKKAGIKIDINTPTPATDAWTSGGNSYKYNDATGAGCTNGQMTISGGSLAKLTGANNPVYTMPVGAFDGTSSVTLLNNTSATAYEADLTNYTLSQNIPAEQADGTYSLPMNITYVQQ